MQIQFENKAKEFFYLGTVSFNILDKNNVFDKYQQCENYYSNIILAVKKEDVNSLADDVLKTIAYEKKKTAFLGQTLRQDLIKKLENFSIFVKQSNGFKVTIP